MRPKVVLYNPQAVFWAMPLALLAVASALDRRRYEVVIVDGRLDSLDVLLSHLDDAVCLGVTVLTGAPLHDALRVSRLARQRRPELPVIWGGWHPSLFPVMCGAEPSVTAAVLGQGEETFREVVDRIAAGASLDGVAGIVHRSGNGEPKHNPARPMADIDSFPGHDYNLIPVDRYFARKGQKQLDYISSQGCRFRCSFCADPTVYERGWYGVSPDRVVAEVGSWWRRYRFDDLAFQDETYFTYAPRVAEIAEGFLREELDFTWFATMRADQGRRLDDAVFDLCRRSGLRRVMIGLEAGSQKTLDAIQKDIAVEDIWASAEKLDRHGIAALINVIVGFPGESEASVDETLRVARELRAMNPDFEIAVFYFKPYPGNPIAVRLRAEGYRLPGTLEEWAEFDYIGEANPWLSDRQQAEIEHFKFYQRFAYEGRRSVWRWPLRKLSRWRVERRDYRFPLERRLIEGLRPRQSLS